jgi:hypothetical protein
MLTGPANDRQFPLKDGDILFSYNRLIAPNYEDKTEFKFGFDIAFGQGRIVHGKAIVPTLTEYVNVTECVVDTFARNVFGSHSVVRLR